MRHCLALVLLSLVLPVAAHAAGEVDSLRTYADSLGTAAQVARARADSAYIASGGGLPPQRDLMDVLCFQGSVRDRFSLDYWCRRFDIESPKGSIDGSQVGRAYRDGRIEDIGEYCLRDVRATAQLFRRVGPTMLPPFRG